MTGIARVCPARAGAEVADSIALQARQAGFELVHGNEWPTVGMGGGRRDCTPLMQLDERYALNLILETSIARRTQGFSRSPRHSVRGVQIVSKKSENRRFAK